jgi:hypothetical protein
VGGEDLPARRQAPPRPVRHQTATIWNATALNILSKSLILRISYILCFKSVNVCQNKAAIASRICIFVALSMRAITLILKRLGKNIKLG